MTDSPNTVPNVDAGEIAKFNALAEQWWDPNSQFRPLHDINPLRLNYIDERVSLPGKKVIDIGCGGGLLSEGMARRGANVTGILIGWVIMSLPLLLFIPGILKKSPYVASWLSYVSLMYFVLVMALSSGVWIWLLSASSVMMFLGSMMFTRWQKAGI